jgi:glycosyltransferase involved in cell wall biosynthesis
LITVLMPVYNARATLRKAVQSILDQTWKRLELILLDDCSTDDSLAIARELARQDPRIRVVALEENRGPYVAKNIGLRSAQGDYVTVHDADDWAFPTRLAYQIAPLLAQAEGALKVTMGLTLRMDKGGRFTRFQPLNWVTEDGAMRWCFPSPLFERCYFDDKLEAWDSFRVGADAEIVQRIRRFEPEAIRVLNCPVMIQLDGAGSLTKSEVYFNDERGESPARAAYREAWAQRHRQHNSMPKTKF